MHSSRMRTTRLLTYEGGGGVCIQNLPANSFAGGSYHIYFSNQALYWYYRFLRADLDFNNPSIPVMSSNDFQSGGIEGSKGLFAMSGTPTSPPDPSMYPWNWCDGAGAIDLSPASSISSSNDSPDFRRDLKRGRPRADAITTLIVEGTRVNSDIRCKICNRVFPRDKSLQAHMRTHTGKDVRRKAIPSCCLNSKYNVRQSH